jgi:hypothetical protein
MSQITSADTTTSHAAAAVGDAAIYVICPAKVVTGGPELLHQFVNVLRSEGREAYIAYTPLGKRWETPPPYQRYACPVVTEIPDDANTVVVAPETFTRELYRFRRARHVIWWMSVNNYDRGLRRFVLTDIPDPSTALHLFQCAYAREFVRDRFGMEGWMLSDYLAMEYFESFGMGARRNAVAFNPSKGYTFTKKLVAACPGIDFVRLEKMTRTEMRDTLDSCKVYVDFGEHPGKDRIPREAAIRGAVIIVGLKGSARFDEDVPLAPRYKIEPGPDAVGRVRELLLEVLANYEQHHAAQEQYRARIAGEKALFREQLRAIFVRGDQSPRDS